MPDAIDYDGAWKEALDVYLKTFLELCLKHVAIRIDWDTPTQPQDKEFQEVVRGAELGRQHVDKLVKVRGLDGADQWVLIHIEVQAQPDADLPRRLYQYHHRIVDRYGIHTVTLAVLADRRQGWRPASYEEELWGCRVRFDYPLCKFLDFQLDMLEAGLNPAAIVIAAHMEAQATQGDMDARKKSRMRITRRLFEAGWGAKQIRELLRLINWLMVLPDDLEREVAQDVHRMEQEKSMAFIPFLEREAHAKGLQEGLEQGLRQGKQENAADTAVRLARKRLPHFSTEDEAAVRALPLAKLEDLTEALLDFAAIDDLRRWLADKRET